MSEINLPEKICYKKKLTYTQKRRPYKKYHLANWNWKNVLDEALLLKESDKNFLNIISEKYGIVKDTLKYKLYVYQKYGESSLKDNRGINNKILTEDEERFLSDKIKKDYIDRNIPFDDSYLKILAEEYWRNLHKDNDNDKDFKVSNGWCTDFKRKWRLSSVKPSMKKRHIINENIKDINDFINECTKEFNRVGAEYFYNIDETFWKTINAIQITYGHTNSESTMISYLGNEKEGFTAIFCINAKGKFLEPIVIKKGKTKRCLESINACKDVQKCYSNNGWINNGIMVCLLENIVKQTKGKDTVLLLDNYSVHNNDFIIKEAALRNIKLLFIPPNMTHKYQPLDVGINGPLKSCARKLWKKDRLSFPEKIPKLIDGIRFLTSVIKEIINEYIIVRSFQKALPFLWKEDELLKSKPRSNILKKVKQ